MILVACTRCEGDEWLYRDEDVGDVVEVICDGCGNEWGEVLEQIDS